MSDDSDGSAGDADDVEGHVTAWDVDRLMTLPSSGAAEQQVRTAETRTEAPAAPRPARRPRRFGRAAPSPSTG